MIFLSSAFRSEISHLLSSLCVDSSIDANAGTPVRRPTMKIQNTGRRGIGGQQVALRVVILFRNPLSRASVGTTRSLVQKGQVHARRWTGQFLAIRLSLV